MTQEMSLLLAGTNIGHVILGLQCDEELLRKEAPAAVSNPPSA